MGIYKGNWHGSSVQREYPKCITTDKTQISYEGLMIRDDLLHQIKELLITLSERVIARLPSMPCHIQQGKTLDGPIINLSCILRSLEAIELVFLKDSREKDVVISGDLLFSYGDELTKMTPLAVSNSATSEEIQAVMQSIGKYILSQEDRLVEELEKDHDASPGLP